MSRKSSDRVSASRETADRTVRTMRVSTGDKVRVENWDGQTVVWNATEGRRATEAECREVGVDTTEATR